MAPPFIDESCDDASVIHEIPLNEVEAPTIPEGPLQHRSLHESLLTKSTWDATTKTGEFVHYLATGYNEATGTMKPVEAFNSLEQGVQIVATKCPVEKNHGFSIY